MCRANSCTSEFVARKCARVKSVCVRLRMFDAKAITLIIPDLAANKLVKIVIIVAAGTLGDPEPVGETAFVCAIDNDALKVVLRGRPYLFGTVLDLYPGIKGRRGR